MSIEPTDGCSPFDSIKQVRSDGSEYWPARDLMPFLGYSRWENFVEAMEQARAVIAAEQGEMSAMSQVAASTKITKNARGHKRDVPDVELSRHAAYLTAMRGDSRKPEIRAALIYFAVKTREAEMAQQAPVLPADYEQALVALLDKVREKKALEEKVLALEPDANAWSALASAVGDYSLRDAAHILNRDPNISTGQNRLMAKLFELGMVDRKGIPYAKNERHLRELPRAYEHPHTKEAVLGKPQIRITVTGLRYLHERMGGTDPLRFNDWPAAG